jgi:hypothetical protein
MWPLMCIWIKSPLRPLKGELIMEKINFEKTGHNKNILCSKWNRW